jgi:hypothetical protein
MKHNFKMMFDDNGVPFTKGDTLISKDGYSVTVDEDEHGYFGWLICPKYHPCRNIKYHINDGKGHVKK